MAEAPAKAAPKGPSTEELAARLAKLEKAPASSSSEKAPASSSSSGGMLTGAATSAINGKRLVVVGTIATGVLTLVAAYRRPTAGRSPFRVVLGVFIAGVLLAVLAEVAPKLAAAFAMTMLATAAFVVGGDAWEGISAITATSSSSAGKTVSPPAPK